ncbi:MAG: HAMP domain-containing protein, partial [Bdellovibrionales bacterium]|nr:HAMP domain-containing protein [Bdellovibrionales bacterium]
MGIRSKLMVLILSVLVLAISGILWRSTQVFFQDKSDFVKQLTNKLSSGTTYQVSDRLRLLRDKLALFVITRESLRSVSKDSKKYSTVLFEQFVEFYSVSALELKPAGWQMDWTETKPSLFWPDGTETYLLKDVKSAAVESNRIYIFESHSPDNKPLFAVAMKIQFGESGKEGSSERVVVGIVPPDYFADLVSGYKGDLNSVYVINDSGWTVAHPDDSQVGTRIEGDPISNEVSQKNRRSGAGTYVNSSRNEIIGSFNEVPGANLVVVATTPTREAFQAATDLRNIVIIFGIGTLLVGFGLAIFFATRITKPLHELGEAAAAIGSGNFNVQVEARTKDEVGRLAKNINQMRASLKERDELLDHQKQALIQSEKMGAFGQLSAGIAHEVKNPLAGILGHAQLAKGKSTSEDVKKHLEVIEKETRRTKEIIENLMKFARAEKADLIPTDLTETVRATIDLVDHQLGLMGVRIHRNLQGTPQVSANANQLQQVFLNIMMNAGHAMEKSEKKELTVTTESAGDFSRVKITDTGSGIPKEIQQKIFEPFFTTKPAGKGTGLGLSVSFGIVRDHKGKIYIESAPGKGTTFFIEIPVVGKNPQVHSTPAEGPKEPTQIKVAETKKRPSDPGHEDIGAPPIPQTMSAPPAAPSAAAAVTPKSASQPPKPPAFESDAFDSKPASQGLDHSKIVKG